MQIPLKAKSLKIPVFAENMYNNHIANVQATKTVSFFFRIYGSDNIIPVKIASYCKLHKITHRPHLLPGSLLPACMDSHDIT